MNFKLFAASLALGWPLFLSAAEPVVVTMVCDSPHSLKLCQEGAEIWAKKTGNKVKFIPLAPNAEQLGINQQFLAEKSTVVDVYRIDVVWIGLLSRYLVDLSKYAAPTVADHFPTMINNNRVDGKLVAMPWYIDSGLLYYRKDLLDKYDEKVPETWEELEATAARIQAAVRKADGAKTMWGYVWQGKAYEGLTCNALEWLDSYNGGTVVDAQGKIDVHNPRAAQALQRARGWVGTISPPEVLGFDEEASRAAFQSGNAVFMRNWPYAWKAVNEGDSPIRGLVGVAALPRGGRDGRQAATLGGQLLAVSKYSRHVEQAVDLVMFMTGREEQKRRAIEGGFNPTIEALYKDRDLIAANSFQAGLHDTFSHTTARPSSQTRAKYNQVSSEFWNAAHGVLKGENDADTALKTLEARLKALTRNGSW